ncbi:hypothetical protein [Geobacillus subterraneus]|uniref:Uncharacterized protein n=1 Tax=Geobacillus subterraneus TaxID=129338 RepID=A0A679FY01_9BACL|nr:hypothetical protein [Geobacillus subterraneus]BBW98977.1 hypothetical protein GsuE55_38100 [Geobacillus subterraneus]
MDKELVLTKEEQKALRLEVSRLLDFCHEQKCPYRSGFCASTRVCPSCPVGKAIQALGKKLWMATSSPSKGKPWTEEDEAFLIQHFLQLSVEEIAKKRGHSLYRVLYRVRVLQAKGVLGKKRNAGKKKGEKAV